MNSSHGSFGPACRSQFVLGPAYLHQDTWRQVYLGEHLKLSVQNELELHQSSTGICQLTMLGFMLDWSRPEASNADIVNGLAGSCADLNACLKATDEIGGRWVLIYQDDIESVIFSDAAGLRQVCYANDAGDNRLWIGSQPDLLNGMASLDEDPEALSFFDSMAKTDAEAWWPGSRLLFRDASVLLPNHYLNISSGKCQRFWPRSAPKPISKEEGCRRIAEKLVGVTRAAVSRGELTLGLSAGWDSRLLLAAAHGVIGDLMVHTVQTATMDDKHYDVAVPKKLAKHLGLNHLEIHHPPQASNEFLSEFHKHTWRPHDRFAAGAQAEFEKFGYSKVAIIGNLSEVAKLPYRNQIQEQQSIDGNTLAALVGMGGHDFASEAMSEWLTDANDLQGYNVLDVFYWEQRIGRWLAANFIEFDFAWKDIFVPFNVRSLICDLLAVDERERHPASLHLYVDIMQSLWPEVLQEPINPQPKPGLLQKIRRKLKLWTDW